MIMGAGIGREAAAAAADSDPAQRAVPAEHLAEGAIEARKRHSRLQFEDAREPSNNAPVAAVWAQAMRDVVHEISSTFPDRWCLFDKWSGQPRRGCNSERSDRCDRHL